MHNFGGEAQSLPHALLAYTLKLDIVAPNLPYLIRYNGHTAIIYDKQGVDIGHINPATSGRYTWELSIGE